MGGAGIAGRRQVAGDGEDLRDGRKVTERAKEGGWRGRNIKVQGNLMDIAYPRMDV